MASVRLLRQSINDANRKNLSIEKEYRDKYDKEYKPSVEAFNEKTKAYNASMKGGLDPQSYYVKPDGSLGWVSKMGHLRDKEHDPKGHYATSSNIIKGSDGKWYQANYVNKDTTPVNNTGRLGGILGILGKTDAGATVAGKDVTFDTKNAANYGTNAYAPGGESVTNYYQSSDGPLGRQSLTTNAPSASMGGRPKPVKTTQNVLEYTLLRAAGNGLAPGEAPKPLSEPVFRDVNVTNSDMRKLKENRQTEAGMVLANARGQAAVSAIDPEGVASKNSAFYTKGDELKDTGVLTRVLAGKL